MKNRKDYVNKLILSIMASLLLLIACYLIDNIPYPFGAKTGILTFKEKFIRNSKTNQTNYDSVVFVNSGYDIQLVDTDNGKEAITNRETLHRFLEDIDNTEYKYIFIDIRFEKGLVTPIDSVLVSKINSMRDITIAKHWNYNNEKDFELIDESLLDKAAYCDYVYSLYNTSFSKYQFNQKNGPSAALDIYQKVNKRDVKKRLGLFYTDKRSICFNSLFLTISDNFLEQESEDHSARYLNLGSDIYDWYTIDDFKKYCKGKIICIGDFAFDRHDTYYGKQPGTYLHWLAYDSLCNKKHIVKCWLLILLLILYASIFYCKTIKIDLAHYFRNRFLSFLISLIGSSLVLFMACFILYWLSGTVISVFFPSLVFSFYNLILQYKEYDGNKKEF